MIAPVVTEATRDRHPERTRGGRSWAPTLTSRRFLTLAAVMLAATMALVAAGTAAARPSCMGHKATKVGNRHGNHIKGTHHRDVIAALGGRDVIISNGGRDVICGGGGNDRIIGGSHPSRLRRDDPSKLIGGPGNDYILGGYDNDFIVGDNAKVSGNAIGHVGKDELDGDYGHDFIVGDNFSRFNAKGGKHDRLLGQKQNDTLIGDSAVSGNGTARGGGNDHFESMSDKDFEVGRQLFTPREGRRRRKGHHQRRAAARFRRRRQLHEDRAGSWRRPRPDTWAPGAGHRVRRQLRRPRADPRGQARLSRRRRERRPPVRRARPGHVQWRPRSPRHGATVRVCAGGPLGASGAARAVDARTRIAP